MPEKDLSNWTSTIDALLTSALFAFVGVSIGIGRLMAGNCSYIFN